MMERPIRTCTIQSGGINKLQEVDKEDFCKMLLRSIQDNSEEIQKNKTGKVIMMIVLNVSFINY